MIRLNRHLLVLGCVAVLLVVGVRSLTTAATVPGSISLSSYCDNLASQTAAIQQQCDQLKRQGFINAQATARAQSRATSVVSPINPAISGTPVSLGYIAPQDREVKALTPSAVIPAIVGHPWQLTSAWQAGALLNTDPTSPNDQNG